MAQLQSSSLGASSRQFCQGVSQHRQQNVSCLPEGVVLDGSGALDESWAMRWAKAVAAVVVMGEAEAEGVPLAVA